jgi:hypothetical protein
MMAALCMGFLVLGAAVHLFLAKHTQPQPEAVPAEALKNRAAPQQLCSSTSNSVSPNTSGSGSAAGTGSGPGQCPHGSSRCLLRFYAALWQRGFPSMLARSVLLVPLLAVLFDLALALCTLLQMPIIGYRACQASSNAASGTIPSDGDAEAEPAVPQQQAPVLQQQLLLGCMVPAKCFRMRSIITAAFQSLPSIAFTTWAYLSLHTYNVGKSISATVYLLNLGTSMLHTLVAAWVAKELLVRHGSLVDAFKALVSLGPGPAAGPAVVQEAAGGSTSSLADLEMHGGCTGQWDAAGRARGASSSRCDAAVGVPVTVPPRVIVVAGPLVSTASLELEEGRPQG